LPGLAEALFERGDTFGSDLVHVVTELAVEIGAQGRVSGSANRDRVLPEALKSSGEAKRRLPIIGSHSFAYLRELCVLAHGLERIQVDFTHSLRA
jgi:hypothetical protein